MEKKSENKGESKKEKKSLYQILEFKSEKDIAMDFAMKVHKKFDRIVKSSVLFGSQAKNTANAIQDVVDIVLIVDNASIKWDMEVVAWYREELSKLINSLKYSKDLHINQLNFQHGGMI